VLERSQRTRAVGVLLAVTAVMEAKDFACAGATLQGTLGVRRDRLNRWLGDRRSRRTS